MPDDLSEPYVDDPACPVTYVDSFEIRMDSAGMMRVDCCVQRWNPNEQNDSKGRRMLVARLAMSLPIGGALSDALRRVALANLDTSKSAGSWRPPREWVE